MRKFYLFSKYLKYEYDDFFINLKLTFKETLKLRKWIIKEKGSLYENPYGIVTENGYPVDFITSIRVIKFLNSNVSKNNFFKFKISDSFIDEIDNAYDFEESSLPF